MKKIEFETKNLDEALKLACEELKAPKDKVKLEILDEKKSLFGLNKQYKVEATIVYDGVLEGLNFLKQTIDNMGVKATVELKRRNERELTYLINSEENPLLIGKNGRTLEALQFLTRDICNMYQSEDEKFIVLVDVGGYKEQRKKQLEILATKTAKEVAKTKIAASLQPMNAYERRVIHTKLSEWRDVVTESVGQEPQRYLVIKPKNK